MAQEFSNPKNIIPLLGLMIHRANHHLRIEIGITHQHLVALATVVMMAVNNQHLGGMIVHFTIPLVTMANRIHIHQDVVQITPKDMNLDTEGGKLIVIYHEYKDSMGPTTHQTNQSILTHTKLLIRQVNIYTEEVCRKREVMVKQQENLVQ
jgi:hypothetical protein